MLKKILALSLMIAVFTLGSSVSVFASVVTGEDIQPAKQVSSNSNEDKLTSSAETSREKFKKSIIKKDFSNLDLTEKSNLKSYDKPKNQGKDFSTGTKIAIGFGIAAVALGVFIFAASRDKIKYNGYGF